MVLELCYVMVLELCFICIKLVWFETSNKTTCHDRWEGGSLWGIAAREPQSLDTSSYTTGREYRRE